MGELWDMFVFVLVTIIKKIGNGIEWLYDNFWAVFVGTAAIIGLVIVVYAIKKRFAADCHVDYCYINMEGNGSTKIQLKQHRAWCADTILLHDTTPPAARDFAQSINCPLR